MSLIHTPDGEPTSFRDRTTSIQKDGRRSWIYPKKPEGRFYNARTIVSIFLLAFLFGAPFIQVDGHPFMLFNIIERKFVIFGLVFFPQDFYLVVLGVLTLLVTVFLFTAIFGRVWCGWLCPQTVFLEMLFRRIEYFIEGSHLQQRRLNEGPMSGAKFFKKALKHIIFFGLAFLIGNTFLAYIIGSEQLYHIVTSPPIEHYFGLSLMIIFSLLFYGVFAWFREQACIVVCPYGRYQSALVDENSIGVNYDFNRGEPRGRLVKIERRMSSNQSLPNHGDCVDCHQCVDVCPTGIDIRNGIQLECVNCTACIDACDAVMDKIKKPRGLIRYTSLNAVREGKFKWVTPRVIGYAAVWILITSIFTYFFLMRPMTEILILRQPGTTSQQQANGEFINFYTIQVANKQSFDVPIELKLLTPQQGSITMLNEMSVMPHISIREGRFFLSIPQKAITSADTPVKIGVFSNGKLVKEVETRFLAMKTSQGAH